MVWLASERHFQCHHLIRLQRLDTRKALDDCAFAYLDGIETIPKDLGTE